VTRRGNLPGQLTSFVGRQATVDLVSRRLKDDRLVTLVGPGGCGKTRLAIEVGRKVSNFRDGGAFFVDLSGLSDPGLVPGAVLHALGLRSAPGHDPIEVLVNRAYDREVLVILDNCEHMLEVCARLADHLARGCPRAWVLATSRERLGVTGEVVVPVEGLQLPDRTLAPGQEWLENSESGRLFMETARRARPGFSVDDADAASVARICERLDGIPLAIEMVAAWVRLMSVGAIAGGLSDRFRLLVDTDRARPARHKTLLASIEWSCGLLRQDELVLLRRLSVFVSGFSVVAVENVCTGDGVEPEDALALLSSLVDKCLVQADPGRDRLRLHETIRAYAGAALEGEGATAAIRNRHLRHFADLGQAIGPKTFTGEVPVVLAALRPDIDNMRAAMDWAVESEQYDAAAALLVALGGFLFALGLSPEGLARCERLLAIPLAPSRRVGLLHWAASFARNSDPSLSSHFASELTALGRSIGDDLAIARGFLYGSNVRAWGAPEEALEMAEDAIYFAQKARRPQSVAASLSNKAWANFWLGRPREALSLAEDSLRAAQACDYHWAKVEARTAASIAATYCGWPKRALEEAAILFQLSTEMSSPTFACWAERHRGEAYVHAGNVAAQGSLARAKAIAESIDDAFNLACTETCQGQFEVSIGFDSSGYEVLEAGIAELEALGFGCMCIRDRAVLAEVALRRGDIGLARSHLEASAWHLPRKPDPQGVPVLRAEARLARAEECPQRSHSLACDGLEVAASSGQGLWSVDLLELVGITAADLGRHDEAARLLGAAEAQREVMGYVRWAPARDELAPVVARLEASLGPEAFGQALSEGRALSLEEAVAYANRGRGSHSRCASGWESLTPAELRVVGLVAQRLTNAEIAAKLFVSTATVKSHLTRVFDKLGVDDRSQLAVVAAAHLAAGRT
jgi:predicted ATPase/DNA-binding CsgD family transcriptional regulator